MKNEKSTIKLLLLLVFHLLNFHLGAALGVDFDTQEPLSEGEINATATIEVLEDLRPKVVDLQNRALMFGDSYVIMFGSKAGVGIQKKNNTCPLYVAQQSFTGTDQKPYPLSFLKLNFLKEEYDTIHEGMPVFVRFDAATDALCVDPVGWRVDEEEMTGFVRTGAITEDDGSIFATNYNVFRIMNSGEPLNTFSGTPVYKLQYCSMVIGKILQECKDIGVLQDPVTGRPFLVVVSAKTKYPFLIEFQETRFVTDKLFP